MKFAVMFEDQTGMGMEVRKKHMPSHLQFLDENSSAISDAGPLLNPDKSLAGGMWIVEADDIEQVQKLVREDPFWATGLRKDVRILAWNKVFADGKRNI